MGEEETAARSLAARLAAEGAEGQPEGRGVHWHVNVTPRGPRSVLVNCFWYHGVMVGLMLGMNPRNARTKSRSKPQSYTGPEYLVILRDGGTRIADGRTRIEAEAVRAVSRWIEGASLDDVTRDLPFVDRQPRALRKVGALLATGLRWEVGPEPLCELWTYGDGRSCKTTLVDDDQLACSFYLGQAQIAYSEELEDVPASIAAWLVERVSIGELAKRFAGIELESHAPLLESDPARWHWQHVLERIADSDDVLAPLRELIAELAKSPIATKFYSFSSMNRFCFSASSHYPWVNDGLPVVAPAADGTYVVDSTPCALAPAVSLIEARLAAYPITPFFGSAPEHEFPMLQACLREQGSALVPVLIKRQAWYRLEINRQSRRCIVSGRHVSFQEDGTHEVGAIWPTLDAAVRALRRFLEDAVSLESIAEDPLAEHVAKRGPGFMTVGGRTIKSRE
jgi:hypothetical protein